MKDNQIVTMYGDHPTTNTLIVSEHFGKNHKDVLRALRELISDCEEEFGRRNFAPAPYYDAQGKQRTMHALTKEGFMLLAMGFTGANATKLKIAFIQEFNRMESELKNRQPLINDAMREELLKANPLWAKIARYDGKGLTTMEICILIQRHPRSLGRHRRRMEACGLLAPRSNHKAIGQKTNLPMIEEEEA